MNLKMQLLIIKHLRILRFMGAMRAIRFRGSLIMALANPRRVPSPGVPIRSIIRIAAQLPEGSPTGWGVGGWRSAMFQAKPFGIQVVSEMLPKGVYGRTEENPREADTSG